MVLIYKRAYRLQRSLQWIHRQSMLLHNFLYRPLYVSRQNPVLLDPLYLNRSLQEP